ncbi:uncharacterized protein LOC113231526 [Hyposmocoma kahamanoa]|uniref:uncharacterized protein LOC113231526 n=1 Tax=Hyposmocoma kahamanoa TaxID=1477025 RepID=UPI000E6D7CC7|nr:uncharacterized protein LOC113231526 [Hyposmocoma kahamanoa]
MIVCHCFTAPNHVPKSYLETLLRKFAKPLQDIQELAGEGVQLEFSIGSPDKTPMDIDESGEKSSEHEIRRLLRGKMINKRGPSRIRSISRLPPTVRILSQQPSHLQTIKPRGQPPIKQSNKPQKRPPLRLNKMPNKSSLLTKPVNKQRSRQHLVIPQSQHGQTLPEIHESQQRAHQERIAVTSHTVLQPSNQPPLSSPLPNLSASAAASHPAMPPGLSHSTIMRFNYHPQTLRYDKKEIDLEDINKAFVDMEKRLRSGIVNETEIDDKNVLNNDALNKTLQIFEKRILDSIGGLHHDELKEPVLKKKQREKLLCDDAKILQEALTPVSFEELWKYLGNYKCEEDNDREDDTNDNIFIHTGDHSPPLKIPLANVYSRLIY